MTNVNPLLNSLRPLPDDPDQPLQPIQQAQQQQGQLQPIGTHPQAAPAHFQPNPMRQQNESYYQGRLDKLNAPREPAHGFWGKTGRVLENIGNVAGDIFAPSTMALIPGTQLNKQMERGTDIRELKGLQEQDSADEQAFNKEQESAAKQPLQDAQAREANARADELENPQEKPDKFTFQQTDHGLMRIDSTTGEATPVTYQGQTLQPKPAAPKEISPVQDLQNQILAAEEKGDTATAKTLQQRLRDLTPNAEASLASQMARFAAGQGDKQGKQDTQTRAAAYKAFQPAMDSGERFNVMAKNYEDAIKNHDQQAMLSLLANHLGMTMGLQKGARLTKDIIHEAQESRPWLQGLAAKFDQNGILSGVTLTPEQMRQMVDLGRGRFSEDTVKARSESRYLGAQDDGPDRTPSKSTINFYLGQANGDVKKAKQLATDDGWTVK